ncbi:hypothetical protein I2F30_11965, partial [Acinetobacter sp. SCC474]|nr:hypothetical protein [Acinetobacter pollinis]MBF7691444.1 hypothetical protein [Acinetobacter pollinis]MBF7698579.1 hypothetical protein [Acinetobacter pollinis]MBF7699139.1 hypothetical protein [Acinetobacter pollinis]
EIQVNNNHQEYIDDLKRLIESHELVEKMGGIECLKDMALYGVTQEKFRDQLKQAIADVESFQ